VPPASTARLSVSEGRIDGARRADGPVRINGDSPPTAGRRIDYTPSPSDARVLKTVTSSTVPLESFGVALLRHSDPRFSGEVYAAGVGDQVRFQMVKVEPVLEAKTLFR